MNLDTTKPLMPFLIDNESANDTSDVSTFLQKLENVQKLAGEGKLKFTKQNPILGVRNKK